MVTKLIKDRTSIDIGLLMVNVNDFQLTLGNNQDGEVSLGQIEYDFVVEDHLTGRRKLPEGLLNVPQRVSFPSVHPICL